MLRSLPIRALLALSMMVAMGLVVPAHHFGGEMFHASNPSHHAEASHHDGEGCGGEEQPHDSSHCSICVFAGGLMVVAMVDVIVPRPELADQRHAFEPVEAVTQIQPTPAAPRAPPLALIPI